MTWVKFLRYAGPRKLHAREAVRLLDLVIAHHPQGRLVLFGNGSSPACVELREVPRGLAFYVMRFDGTEHRLDVTRLWEPPRTMHADACRFAVKEQIDAALERIDWQSAVCPVTKDPLICRDLCDVDHAPPHTFAGIHGTWSALNGTSHTLTLRPDADAPMFADPAVAESFARFHAARARLRVVTKYANQVALR